MIYVKGNKFFREATPEEREAVNNYIKSISKETGIRFYDLYTDDKIYLIPIDDNKPIKVVFPDD